MGATQTIEQAHAAAERWKAQGPDRKCEVYYLERLGKWFCHLQWPAANPLYVPRTVHDSAPTEAEAIEAALAKYEAITKYEERP